MIKPKSYNIFGELASNIEDFDEQGVYIVGKPSPNEGYAGAVKGTKGGYYFSQRETLEAIDMASASKFKDGLYDSEGKRKTYLNIVNFHKDVALNQININASNYIFMPTESQWTWPVTFMDKKFKEYCDENSYDDVIDELAEDFAGKGTCVDKKVRGISSRVPLRTIRITQTAKSIKDAVENGGYFIIENNMSYNAMSAYKGWDLTGLNKSKNYCVFERYSLIPKGKLLAYKGEHPTPDDWDTMVQAVQILVPDVPDKKAKAGEETGTTLFLEEISDISEYFDEAHYARRDGRWLGIGEIEKQLENQISRNLTANLRRRGLLWATKKLYQSTDPDVKRNLLMEAKDGEVIEVKQNGQLSQINTQSQQLGDFIADENSVKENSQQISFSFEASTGESMPSGTAFRLGVILQAAVSKYFKRKQDTFSNFLKRSFFNQILPTFKADNKYAHTLVYSPSDDNYDQIREALVVLYANDRVKKAWINHRYLQFDQARAEVEQEMNQHPNLFIDVPDGFYQEPQCYMRLNINEPIAADIETLTSLYQVMAKMGDPRADKVLKAILTTKGKNYDQIVGPAPKPTPQATPAPNPTAEAPAPEAVPAQ